jgi:hypothetical protein
MGNGSCSVPCYGGRELVLPQCGWRIGRVKLRSLWLNPAASRLIWACIFCRN